MERFDYETEQHCIDILLMLSAVWTDMQCNVYYNCHDQSHIYSADDSSYVQVNALL